MAQSFLDDITGLPQLWIQIKGYVNSHKFDATRMDINVQTGHLIAQESGNLSFSIDSNGHLKSEVV